MLDFFNLFLKKKLLQLSIFTITYKNVSFLLQQGVINVMKWLNYICSFYWMKHQHWFSAEGGDLHRHCIETDIARTEKEICYLIRQILEAVRYLHDIFIVHLDLKVWFSEITTHPSFTHFVLFASLMLGFGGCW